jgi:hypothetical protein
VQTVLSGLFLRNFQCSQSGDRPYEDVEKVTIIASKILAKSGYKPDMKHKFLIILLNFWLLIGTKNTNLAIFSLFFPGYWKLKPPN